MPLQVRPIGPADSASLEAAFERLSAQSRYQRFLGPKPRLTAAELAALTDLDHIERDALAAFEPTTGRLVAIARYASYTTDPGRADIAVTVADEWQGQGLGTLLGRAIVHRAEGSGFSRLSATTLADNVAARALLRRLGFHACGRDGHVIEFGLELVRGATAA